jgi:hypothetical protein
MQELCKLKRGLLPLFFLFLISFVVAQPPVTQVQQFTTGYIIKGTPQEYVLADTDFKFNFFVFNISNGVTIDNTSTTCLFYMANITGDVLVAQNVSYTTYWSITIGGDKFTDGGYYPYGVDCYDTNIGGAITGYFYATADGFPETTEEDNKNSRFMFWIIVAAVYIFLLLSFMIKEPNIAMICSLIMIVIGVYSFSGISGVNNYLTQAFSLVNMALGAYILLRTGIERIQEEM